MTQCRGVFQCQVWPCRAARNIHGVGRIQRDPETLRRTCSTRLRPMLLRSIVVTGHCMAHGPFDGFALLPLCDATPAGLCSPSHGTVTTKQHQTANLFRVPTFLFPCNLNRGILPSPVAFRHTKSHCTGERVSNARFRCHTSPSRLTPSFDVGCHDFIPVFGTALEELTALIT